MTIEEEFQYKKSLIQYVDALIEVIKQDKCEIDGFVLAYVRSDMSYYTTMHGDMIRRLGLVDVLKRNVDEMYKDER